MPRDYPSAQSAALQRIQIASMREKLKLDKAKARQAEADAPSEAVLGPNGRPRVRYKDMPELHPDDETQLVDQFNRMACPHMAVLKYRPGYEGRGFSEDRARGCWWFYDQGVSILFALQMILSGPQRDMLIEAFAAQDLDILGTCAKMNAFLIFNDTAKTRAADGREMSLEASNAVTQAEVDEVWEELKRKFVNYASQLSEEVANDNFAESSDKNTGG